MQNNTRLAMRIPTELLEAIKEDGNGRRIKPSTIARVILLHHYGLITMVTHRASHRASVPHRPPKQQRMGVRRER